MGFFRRAIEWVKGQPSKKTLLKKIENTHPRWSERHSDLIRLCGTMDYSAQWHWKTDELKNLTKDQLQKVLNKCA